MALRTGYDELVEYGDGNIERAGAGRVDGGIIVAHGGVGAHATRAITLGAIGVVASDRRAEVVVQARPSHGGGVVDDFTRVHGGHGNGADFDGDAPGGGQVNIASGGEGQGAAGKEEIRSSGSACRVIKGRARRGGVVEGERGQFGGENITQPQIKRGQAAGVVDNDFEVNGVACILTRERVGVGARGTAHLGSNLLGERERRLDDRHGLGWGAADGIDEGGGELGGVVERGGCLVTGR